MVLKILYGIHKTALQALDRNQLVVQYSDTEQLQNWTNVLVPETEIANLREIARTSDRTKRAPQQ